MQNEKNTLHEMPDIVGIALASGLVPGPAAVFNNKSAFRDAVQFQAQAPAAMAAAEELDILADEIPPWLFPDGIMSSAGQTAAMVGWVYGMSAVVISRHGGAVPVQPSAADVGELLQAGLAIGLQTGGQVRSVPLAECLRIAPGIAILDNTNAADTYGPNGCPNGQVQYRFPGGALPWDGASGSRVILYGGNGYTNVAAVELAISFYGIFAPGKAGDVLGGATDVRCDPRDKAALLEALEQVKSMRARIGGVG